MSRYLLHVLIEDEEAVRRADRRREGEREWAVARARARARAHRPQARTFQGPINEWPPAADATGPINPTPIPGARFDLFYVMSTTPESISRGTLLFCVCMRLYA